MFGRCRNTRDVAPGCSFKIPPALFRRDRSNGVRILGIHQMFLVPTGCHAPPTGPMQPEDFKPRISFQHGEVATPVDVPEFVSGADLVRLEDCRAASQPAVASLDISAGVCCCASKPLSLWWPCYTGDPSPGFVD